MTSKRQGHINRVDWTPFFFFTWVTFHIGTWAQCITFKRVYPKSFKPPWVFQRNKCPHLRFVRGRGQRAPLAPSPDPPTIRDKIDYPKIVFYSFWLRKSATSSSFKSSITPSIHSWQDGRILPIDIHDSDITELRNDSKLPSLHIPGISEQRSSTQFKRHSMASD